MEQERFNVVSEGVVVQFRLTWKHANSHLSMLQGKGVDAGIAIVFDSENLKSGLVTDTVELNPEEDDSTQEFSLLRIDLKKLTSHLFTPKGKLKVSNTIKTEQFQIENRHFSIGQTALFVLGGVAGLILQDTYLKSSLIQFSSGIVTSLCSLVVLVTSFIFLPRLFSNRRIISLYEANKDKQLLTGVEKPTLSIKNQIFTVMNEGFTVAATIQRNKMDAFDVKCLSPTGELIFSVTQKKEADDLVEDMASGLSDMTVVFRVIRNISLFFEKKLSKIFSKPNKASSFSGRVATLPIYARVINADSECVGVLYKGKITEIEYKENVENKLLLVLFSLVALGVN